MTEAKAGGKGGLTADTLGSPPPACLGRGPDFGGRHSMVSPCSAFVALRALHSVPLQVGVIPSFPVSPGGGATRAVADRQAPGFAPMAHAESLHRGSCQRL